MSTSAWVAVAVFSVAFVFASLLFGIEMKGILQPKRRRLNSRKQPVYTPAELPFWMPEKLLALSASVLAISIVLLTK